MYLSKLEIIGFKSFAQRTLLKFDAGMTSIVGPNGCGKTNVVDAIRWALGEQKAGTLRSDVMENVIFNGTRSRKPLGMAEVSLTIENTKGILPTEYSEVTITRRLFRSGESEYLLNKTQCRLKDIVELFMDTGMGANAYSVIELKMIETILSERTEERRKLFEEAAGVTKYKARRKEALRRLDQVSTDLERVDDIVKEVTKNVGSLERQAERALKHAELSGGLRTLEIDLIEREYATTWKRLEPLKVELSNTETTKTQITDELSKLESLLDVIEHEEDEIEGTLASSERGVKEKSEILARTRETIIATEERIRSLSGQKERAIADKERLEKDHGELTQRLTSLTAEIIQATESRESFEFEKSEQEERRAAAEAIVRERRTDLQSVRDEVFTVLSERNKKSNEIERSHARIEDLGHRLARFESEYRQLEEKVSQFSIEQEKLQEERAEAESRVREMESAFQKASDEKDKLKTKLDELQNESFNLQNEIGKTLSKIEFFTGLVEQGIGAGEGTEFLLNQHGWSSSEPVTVADAMTTAPDLRAAFESALGEVAHYLIVPRSTDAFHAVEMLRHSQKGKATFICLDRVPQIADPTFSLPTGATSAIEAAQFPEMYANLFRLLLGNVVLVNSIDQAFSVLDSIPQIEKCVTPDAEVVSREGFVRGGSKRKTEGILIGKREQISELETDVVNLKAQLETLEEAIGTSNRAFESIHLKEHNQHVREAEESKRRVESRVTQIEYELQHINDERTKLSGEETGSRAELSPLEQLINELAPQVEALDAKHVEAQERAARAQLLVEEAETLLAEEVQRSTEAQVRYAGLTAEVTRLEGDERQTARTLENTEKLQLEREIERDRVEIEVVEFSEKLAEFRTMLAQIDDELQQMVRQRDEVAELRKEKQLEAHKYRETLREERAHHDKTLNISHELALKIQEMETKILVIGQRAKEEFELEHVERKEYSEDDPFNFGDAREEVRELKQKIKNLGAVNSLAYEEFKQESERLEFLTTQRKDLAEAQKTLVQTIEEINETATSQFLETFEKIRMNFQEIFRSLFTEGDECDLNLEADKDPLEAQVEIIAKPRGKRPHSIDLLSGGEKTMTAIALLFAIYLVKPSPFCILDEVDAPLDDSNIDRFLNIIRRFAQDTQFIVVTHNKRTMAAADALYGVTQEEDGISKIVSVRLKRELFESAKPLSRRETAKQEEEEELAEA
jgi:chromosome segregation protein